MSIDDTEVSNLKKICDEIFGEVNFITIFIWQRAFAPVNMNKFASRNHDFVLCYAKQTDFLSWYGLPRSQEADTRYSNPDNDPRGPWTSGDLSVGPPVPEKIYEIVTPSGRVVYPPKGYCWRVTKERFAELLADNRIWFGKDGDSVPRLKRFLSEVKSTITPLTVWTHQEVSHSQDAKKELKELFEDQSVMDYPKPVKLMKRILELSTRENDIILDFFSGSATTAHAVMQLNAEDGGNRKFIMVQLPEKTDETSDAYKAGYKNICEIGKERIRRAGEKIVQETGKTDLDIGFKVFKLDSSNIKEWDPDFENLERDLFDLQNNIKEDRTKEDLLYEILLKIGLPLTVPIEEIDCRGKTIYNVAYGSVLICLEDEIDLDLVQEMLKHRSEHMPPKVILKESGFMSDAVKTNALQTLKKHGITDVRSV
ncbi:site-specific DNA-methyltransferase [Geobacillus zalihae]|uniref:Site-specific DNA-methyltransferase n=1 Tax=Geobacillus zalihae TaxID=213419 RepID=A0A7H1RZM9_9BACL|nr:site-specific DNA-methyltransferase [Geobacillus zalihae]